MTTEERTWKASEKLSAFYLFTCKTWVSAVTGNELSFCRQTSGAEQSEETEGWKQEKKMNAKLACVLGVKEHTQSHGAEANQGPVVRHGCCSDAVIQGSSVVRDTPVTNGRITGFTCAVWMHLAPWLKYRTPALWRLEREGKELIRRSKGLISEEWLKMLNIDTLSKKQRWQQFQVWVLKR